MKEEITSIVDTPEERIAYTGTGCAVILFIVALLVFGRYILYVASTLGII